MTGALQRAREQIEAAIVRAPLRSAALDRRTREALAEIEIAERTGHNHYRAIRAVSEIVPELERAQLEAARDARLTQGELSKGRG